MFGVYLYNRSKRDPQREGETEAERVEEERGLREEVVFILYVLSGSSKVTKVIRDHKCSTVSIIENKN